MRLFISHPAANYVEVIAIRNWLAKCGWDDVFLNLGADRDVMAGRWERALLEVADRCEGMAYILSSG